MLPEILHEAGLSVVKTLRRASLCDHLDLRNGRTVSKILPFSLLLGFIRAVSVHCFKLSGLLRRQHLIVRTTGGVAAAARFVSQGAKIIAIILFKFCADKFNFLQSVSLRRVSPSISLSLLFLTKVG